MDCHNQYFPPFLGLWIKMKLKNCPLEGGQDFHASRPSTAVWLEALSIRTRSPMEGFYCRFVVLVVLIDFKICG